MNFNIRRSQTSTGAERSKLDHRLAAYLAASATATAWASQAEAVIVSNNTAQPFGINGAVPIDFNSDGQIDYEIDHDRVDLGGGNFVDYLQIDKNDVSGASPGEDPLAFPSTFLETFPLNDTPANDTFEAAYVVPATNGEVFYPSALLEGQEIGPVVSVFDFQEGENVYSSGLQVRANRLFDEDHTQVDITLGGDTPDDFYPITNTPGWAGLGGQVRYLGVKMDLQNTDAFNYGWIGVRIDNEADATGEVVGWGYETEAGVSIQAGQTGMQLGDFNADGKVDAADYVTWRKTNSGDANAYTEWQTHFGEPSAGASFAAFHGANQAVPEPSSLLLTIVGGVALLSTFLLRRVRRS